MFAIKKERCYNVKVRNGGIKMQRYYMCIDQKTFFATVECVERGLDPFSTNLVVADPERGPGAICLAVSPKMKM